MIALWIAVGIALITVYLFVGNVVLKLEGAKELAETPFIIMWPVVAILVLIVGCVIRWDDWTDIVANKIRSWFK